MPEYLQLQSNGQITLPVSALRKTKIKKGDFLEVFVEEDGSIHLIPNHTVDHSLVEKSQLADISWAVKNKK